MIPKDGKRLTEVDFATHGALRVAELRRGDPARALIWLGKKANRRRALRYKSAGFHPASLPR